MWLRGSEVLARAEVGCDTVRTPAIFLASHYAHTTTALSSSGHSIADMADTNPPAQPAAAAESAENLHTDPVTGEKISKSELKRRTKQREVEKKKAEKAKALPVQPKKEGKKEEAVSELNPNQYFELRSNKINALRASKNPNP